MEVVTAVSISLNTGRFLGIATGSVDATSAGSVGMNITNADVAQLDEHSICNREAASSSLAVGFSTTGEIMASFFDPEVRDIIRDKFMRGEWTLLRTAQETGLTTSQIIIISRDIRYYRHFLSAWAT